MTEEELREFDFYELEQKISQQISEICEKNKKGFFVVEYGIELRNGLRYFVNKRFENCTIEEKSRFNRGEQENYQMYRDLFYDVKNQINKLVQTRIDYNNSLLPTKEGVDEDGEDDENKSIKIYGSFEKLLNDKKLEYQAKKNCQIVNEGLVFYGTNIALKIQVECDDSGTHFDVIQIGKTKGKSGK